jgi:hypothetical protein
MRSLIERNLFWCNTQATTRKRGWWFFIFPVFYRVDSLIEIRAFPGLKIETWGTQICTRSSGKKPT